MRGLPAFLRVLLVGLVAFALGVLSVLTPGRVSTPTAAASTGSTDYALDTQNDAYLSAEGATVIPPDSGSFTVEMWFKPETVAPNEVLVSQGYSTDGTNTNNAGTYYLKLGASGEVRVLYDGATEVGSGYNLPTSEWAHIAHIVDTSPSTDTSKIYVNGVLVQESSANRGVYKLAGGKHGFHIAALSRSDGDVPDGEIDQVKIWGSALTQQQVQESMHAWGATGVSGSPTLISHYDFNDNSQASTVEDQAGSTDLTLHNAATSDFTALVEADTSSAVGYSVYEFTRSYLTSTGGWMVPAGVARVDAVVVGGGGGGGAWTGAGGGAGGVVAYGDVFETLPAQSPLNVIPATNYQVTVGYGGAGARLQVTDVTNFTPGSNGQPSEFGDLVAYGGGVGASWPSTEPQQLANAGSATVGSGGGATDSDDKDDIAGAGNSDSFVAVGGRGKAGGKSTHGEGRPHEAGGGGGAGENGENPPDSNTSGAGGDGVQISLTGSSRWIAGGGGGGTHADYEDATGEETGGVVGAGGLGGGGAGSGPQRVDWSGSNVGDTPVGQAGQANTGGGGGGAGHNNLEAGHSSQGGQGGSGIVIVRFNRTPDAPTALSAASQDRGAQLTWSAPSHTGGSSITDYRVEYRLSGGAWQTFADGASAATSARVTGLANGQTYEFRVSATAGGLTGATVSATATLQNDSSESPDSGGSSSDSSQTNTPAPISVVPMVPPARLPLPPSQNPTPDALEAPVVQSGSPVDVNSPPRALIAGVPAPVTTEASGTSGIQVRAGALELDLSVPEEPGSGGVGNNPGTGVAELTVPVGKSTRISGGGLLPGSSLQVWLPKTPAGPRELARIPVREDGSFDSDVSLSSDGDDEPLAVGRQVIQVAGFDRDANQTVVDMTVNIAQGPPQPAVIRETQLLPELSSGEALATSAGVPEQMRIEVRPEQSQVAVLATDWSFEVNVAEQSGTLGATAGGFNLTLLQERTADVSGSGFQPGSRVDVWIFSVPTLLGSATVASDGSAKFEIYVDPRFVAAGEHTLQLQGIGNDGYIKAAHLGVMIDQPVSLTPDSASSLLWWVGSALVGALLIVLMVLLLSRLRSPKAG